MGQGNASRWTLETSVPIHGHFCTQHYNFFQDKEDFLQNEKSDMNDFHLHSEMTHFILCGVYYI